MAILLRAGSAAAEPVTIFAAASTSDALRAVLARFQEVTGSPTRGVFAASSTLAKQIANGAPADLFLSASVDWMDYLDEKGAIDRTSRTNLLGNELVLITPRASDFGLPSGPFVAAGAPLATELGDLRLALGDPSHVPAGRYARSALEWLGVWPDLEAKLALTSDVRGALALVDRAVAGAGIVYITDAALAPNVKVVGRFPAESHPPIRYPVALVAGRDNKNADRLMAFLKGPEGRDLFAGHGFLLLGPDS